MASSAGSTVRQFKPARQPYREPCAAQTNGLADGHPAALLFNETLDQRKTEAGARLVRRGCSAATKARLKDLTSLGWVDARPAIVNPDLQLVRTARTIDGKRTVQRRVANGIQENIFHDLADANRIAKEMTALIRSHRAARDVDGDVFCVGVRFNRPIFAFEQLADIDLPSLIGRLDRRPDNAQIVKHAF